MLRAPSEMWSTMVSSVGRYGDRGHDGDIAGGVELSAKVGLGPRGRKRPGEKGKRLGGSPRLQWASKRARGRAGDDEFDGDGGRSPKRGTATWRRCRASGELWVGGEGRGGRGGASELVGGARGGRRWLLWRTAAMVVLGRERERGSSTGERGG